MQYSRIDRSASAKPIFPDVVGPKPLRRGTREEGSEIVDDRSSSNLPASYCYASWGRPFLGHALELKRNPVALLQRGRERCGRIFRFFLAGRYVYVLTGTHAHEWFFQASDAQLDPKELYQFTVPMFGKGVVYDTTPELMSEQLHLLYPAFREERMQQYASVMIQETYQQLRSWKDEGEIDLLSVMAELSTGIAVRCLLGREFRQRFSPQFARLYQDLQAGINLVAFVKPYWPLPAMRRRDRARQQLATIIAPIIADRRRSGIGNEDFIDTLLAARYSNGDAMDDETILGILLALIFGALHSTKALATWSGLLMFGEPTYLKSVLEEQRRVFLVEDITIASLKKLTLLENAIKEAERLYPPVIMLMRTALCDLMFEDWMIPAGSMIMVSPALAGRLGETFHNPEKYDPDRFAAGREEDRRTKYALIGFGGGKHRCIGLHFAYQQIKVIWSVLLQNFDLQLTEQSYKQDYSSTFVVGPQRPSMVRYRRKCQGLR